MPPWPFSDTPATPSTNSARVVGAAALSSVLITVDATLSGDRADAVRRNSLPEELLDSIDLKALLRGE